MDPSIPRTGIAAGSLGAGSCRTALRAYGLAGLAVIGLLALLLTGCRRVEQGSAEGGAGKGPGNAGGKHAEEGNGPGNGDGSHSGGKPLIEYSRTGGFGGFNDHLVIEIGGKGTVTRRSGSRQIHLEKAQVNLFVLALEDAGFSGLKAEYLARGADLFTYRINYRGHTVTAMDSAVPDALQPVIRMLNEIVDGSGVGPQ